MTKISADELRKKLSQFVKYVILDDLGNEFDVKRITDLGRAGKAISQRGEIHWLKTKDGYEIVEV